jgi:hypothetical protein
LSRREEAAHLNALHGAQELLEPLLVAVERTEEVAAVLDLVLGPTGPQGLGQIAPVTVEPGIRHLQDATDVGGLALVQEQARLDGVGVTCLPTVTVPFE